MKDESDNVRELTNAISTLERHISKLADIGDKSAITDCNKALDQLRKFLVFATAS
jgi:hypothetical protein